MTSAFTERCAGEELVTRMRGIESGYKQAEGYIRLVQSPDFALPMAM